MHSNPCPQAKILFAVRKPLRTAFFSFHFLLFFFLLPQNSFSTPSDSVPLPFSNVPRLNASPDTTRLQYFNAQNPTVRFDLADTLLQGFQQYDAARQGQFYDYRTLGDVGSAAFPLAYTPTARRGVALGINAYDIYQIGYEATRFFDLNKAYTHAYYSQATAQTDLIFMATYANNIKGNRGNISLDYRRISEVGIYANQFARHTNLRVNGWFRSKNKRYQGLWAWVQNVNEQAMNGGVQDTSTLFDSGQFSDRSALETNLSTAKIALRNNQLFYTQYLNLLPNSNNLKLKHRFEFQQLEYKFYDTKPALDSAFYQHFQTNNVGIRNFIAWNKWENEATIHLDYRGALDVGVVHSAYFMTQEPRDTVLNNLFLIGDWDLVLGKNQGYGLKLKGHFGLLDNRADYHLEGAFSLAFAKNHRLRLSAYSRGFDPTVQQHRLFVSQKLLWERDFNKTIENKLAGRYDWSDKISVEGNYFLVQNLIYWDTLALPQQTTDLLSVGQLLFFTKLNLKNFYWENALVLQRTDNRFLRFPTLATKQSFYFEGNLFKKALFSRIGIDVRYNSPYFFDDFQPVTGQFFQQNRWEMAMLPIVDAFVNFKVQSFRAFAKIENLNHLIAPNQVYFAAPNYPMRDWTFRFGISWYFVDGLESLTDGVQTNTKPAGVGGAIF